MPQQKKPPLQWGQSYEEVRKATQGAPARSESPLQEAAEGAVAGGMSEGRLLLKAAPPMSPSAKSQMKDIRRRAKPQMGEEEKEAARKGMKQGGR